MAYIGIITRTVLLTESSTCNECGNTWEGHPSDFLRFARGMDATMLPRGVLVMGTGAWVTCSEIPATGMIDGYCAPCAKMIADTDHEDYRNGNWNRRDMEDERFIWAS